jgi:hypothetical protein
MWTWLSVVAGSIFWALQNTPPTELFLVYVPLQLDLGIKFACVWERLVSERAEETKILELSATKSRDSKCNV